MRIMHGTGYVSKAPSMCVGPPARRVLTAAPNGAAERRRQKMVQTADLSPGKQHNKEQPLLGMRPSYVTCLASTGTGFFLKTRIQISQVPHLLLHRGFPTHCVFPKERLGTLGCRAPVEALNLREGVREEQLGTQTVRSVSHFKKQSTMTDP